MTYVYILRSVSRPFDFAQGRPGQLYVGSTTNLTARVAAHNQGKSPHTSKFRPWELVYQEEYESQEDALKREKQIKRWSGKKRLALVNGQLAELKQLSRCKNR